MVIVLAQSLRMSRDRAILVSEDTDICLKIHPIETVENAQECLSAADVALPSAFDMTSSTEIVDTQTFVGCW